MPDIVFTNGCFDILHVGHVRLLRFAASYSKNTLLVVGLNSDDSFRRIKGRIPLTPAEERAEILRSIRGVWQVSVFNEDTPLELITQVKPRIIVKGPDYRDKQVVGADLVEAVLFPPWKIEHSTSMIISRAKGDV